MPLPKHIEDACEEIDAAVYTGDTLLDSRARAELLDYIRSWERWCNNQQRIEDALARENSDAASERAADHIAVSEEELKR